MKIKKAAMISIGAYAPPYVLNNAELETMVETSDEWITKRTGIKERRIAKGELTSDMGYKAALKAIERSGLDKSEIDALICATVTPDHFCMPSTACVIANKLGLYGITALDIGAACTGFIYLLELAKSLIESGAKKNILIIGAEKFSQIIDWEDRSTCVLFGDGAGAAVISAKEIEVGDEKLKFDENLAKFEESELKNSNLSNFIIDVHTSSDGSKADLLITPGCAIAHPASIETIQNKMHFVKMSGNEVFKIAVQTLAKDVVDILEKNQILPEQIDLFIPHQANLRIIEAVKQRLNFSDEKCVLTVAKYGNTSSASIPMAINEAYEDGRLKEGSVILLDAFGGGFTWGSAIIKFGK